MPRTLQEMKPRLTGRGFFFARRIAVSIVRLQELVKRPHIRLQMHPFPSHGASGGAASDSISDFSNRTFVESDGSDPSLWDLSSFRKRRCSATSNAFTCSESSLISSCNRANSALRTVVRAVMIKLMVINIFLSEHGSAWVVSLERHFSAPPYLNST